MTADMTADMMADMMADMTPVHYMFSDDGVMKSSVVRGLLRVSAGWTCLDVASWP